MGPQRTSSSTRGSAIMSLLVLLGLMSSACATTYVVGGTSGWTELAPGSISYDEEFQNIALVVGDSLQFTGARIRSAGGSGSTLSVLTVLRVPEQQLANCDPSNPLANITSWENSTIISTVGSPRPISSIGSPFSDATMSLFLNDTGYWGLISGNEQQCKQGGMHLAVNVSAPTPGSPPSDTVIDAPPVTALATPSPATSPNSIAPSPTDNNGASNVVFARAALLAFAVASVAILVM